MNEPGLLSDLMTPQGQIIDNEGDIAKITVTGRGGQFGLGVGKIFSTPWSNPNSGWMVKLGAGSLHHNVHFDYSENRISPLEDERVKGYDRMRWGACGELWMGYWLMSNDQRINAFVGSPSVWPNLQPRTQNFDTLDVNAPEAGWLDRPRSRLVFHIYQRAKEYWYCAARCPANWEHAVGLPLRAWPWWPSPAKARGYWHEGQTRVLAHRGAPFMWFHVASLGESNRPFR